MSVNPLKTDVIYKNYDIFEKYFKKLFKDYLRLLLNTIINFSLNNNTEKDIYKHICFT